MAEQNAAPETAITPAAPAAGVPAHAPEAVTVPAMAAAAPSRHAPEPAAADPAHDGLAAILARQWPVLALATALTLLAGVVYLMVAAKTYSASAKLRVVPLDTRSLTATAGGGGDGQQPEDYLDTECVVIKSDAVLALALDAVRTLRPFAGAARPLDVLKAGVDAVAAKKGKAIEVSFECRSAADAERVCQAVVDAYTAYNRNYWSTRIDSLQKLLKGGSADTRAELAEKQDRLLAIQRQANTVLDADPDHSPAHLTVVNLRDAKNKAELDAIAARGAYQQAAQTVTGDPAKVAEVERRLRMPGYAANPQDQLKRVQDELQIQRTRLTDAATQYLPNHPVVRQIQARVDQLTVDAVIAAKQWQDAAEGNQQMLARNLADAQRQELEFVQTQLEYNRLSSDVKRLQDAEAKVNNSISEQELSKGAGAVNISVLDYPHADLLHPRPGKTKTLAVAALAGLLAGVGLGCVRDWSDDRFRTLPAVRAAAGAPVLGAIPSISPAVAASAADRGQVVYFDPFGDASESYRTLRTALQFAMPARSKTLLVTSPTAGDGKSTLVSNMAIALAQANRRVLVVDADLRAPVQHRLFGLTDRTGLASVLDGSDSLEDAIQRTGVEGLDVLPAGPIPSNPAEMLNTPTFNDHLNDLADRYDLVLVDSPPVTAVTDARILAALVDASLLVVRLGSSTRRQTEAARDALRGVGARLIGVAVNGVGRRGNLASATGYYGRPEPAAAAGGPPSAPPSTVPPVTGAGRLSHDPLATAVRSAPPAARR